MSDELAIVAPKSIQELKELSSFLAPGIAIPEAYRGKPGDIAACIMTGAELGMRPMQSLRALEAIKGKVALKAEAQVALVRQRKDVCKYFKLVASTDKLATYETQRVDDPAPTTMTFTMAQAEKAQLTGNPTWSKFPDAMLRARASSQLCRAVYSDVLLGLMDPQEIIESVDEPPRQQAPQTQQPVAQKPEELKPQPPQRHADAVDVEARPEQSTQPTQPEADPALALIESAKDVEELRQASLKIGKISDATRKDLVAAAYSKRMAELRGGK
jgi:hypothetical protein